MDNRHKHIEKLINTLVIPKANKILMDAGFPIITNVKVDEILTIKKSKTIRNSDDYGQIIVMVFYENQKSERHVAIIYSPISGMIMNIIPYVMTGDYTVTVENIVGDNGNVYLERFNSINNQYLESFGYYMEWLEDVIERSYKV
jgi:hypothetical protein